MIDTLQCMPCKAFQISAFALGLVVNLARFMFLAAGSPS
jgi:hypothetical protein